MSGIMIMVDLGLDCTVCMDVCTLTAPVSSLRDGIRPLIKLYNRTNGGTERVSGSTLKHCATCVTIITPIPIGTRQYTSYSYVM